jgi:membrane protein DedA with SNARE-associated domain
MTVVAGALRLPQRTFLVGTFFAGLVWATLYFWLGWFLGAGYERLSAGSTAPAWRPVALALGAAAAVGVGLWIVRRRRRSSGPPPARSRTDQTDRPP